LGLPAPGRPARAVRGFQILVVASQFSSAYAEMHL
jgi:hypothetical protein